MLEPDPYGGVPLGAEAMPGMHVPPLESVREREMRKETDEDRTAARPAPEAAPPG
jgi:hypothetical protein